MTRPLSFNHFISISGLSDNSLHRCLIVVESSVATTRWSQYMQYLTIDTCSIRIMTIYNNIYRPSENALKV